MNIILRELRAHIKSILLWSACIIGFSAMGMSEFSAYYNNPEMAAILDTMPQGMLTAFGIQATSLTTVHGFYGILSTYNFIILGINAVLLGSGIIAKEERDKTAEFLMTMPVSRTKVVLSKMVAAILICLIILGVTTATAFVITAEYDPGPMFYDFIKLSTIGLILTQLIFLSFGMMVSAVMKRYKRSSSASLTVLLSTYILSVLVALSEKMDFLKYATPFKYFEPTKLLIEMKIQPVYLFLSVIIIIVCFTGAFIFYPRRDLHI